MTTPRHATQANSHFVKLPISSYRFCMMLRCSNEAHAYLLRPVRARDLINQLAKETQILKGRFISTYVIRQYTGCTIIGCTFYSWPVNHYEWQRSQNCWPLACLPIYIGPSVYTLCTFCQLMMLRVWFCIPADPPTFQCSTLRTWEWAWRWG